MIRVAGRFIYLATPATASRTVSRILLEQLGGEVLAATHHAHLSDMPLLGEHPEPVYSLIRDPYDYVLSRYLYKKKPPIRSDELLEAFIPEYSLENRAHEFGSIMCMYRNYVDQYFLFEDGIKSFFEKIGSPDVEILEDGMRVSKMLGRRLNIEEVIPKAKELIEQHFAEELELYRKVTKEQ